MIDVEKAKEDIEHVRRYLPATCLGDRGRAEKLAAALDRPTSDAFAVMLATMMAAYDKSARGLWKHLC